MQDFRNLVAWQKSHALVLRVYSVTATFPRSEMFGLTSQIRRSAASVAANIAEGACRGGRSFPQFLRIALGSAGELEYLVVLAADLAFIPRTTQASLERDAVENKKIITGLLKSVNKGHRDV